MSTRFCTCIYVYMYKLQMLVHMVRRTDQDRKNESCFRTCLTSRYRPSNYKRPLLLGVMLQQLLLSKLSFGFQWNWKLTVQVFRPRSCSCQLFSKIQGNGGLFRWNNKIQKIILNLLINRCYSPMLCIWVNRYSNDILQTKERPR